MFKLFKKKTPKPLEGVSPICGYKDKKGNFFNTAELAHASNISNEKRVLLDKLEALLTSEYSYHTYALASRMYDNSDKIRVVLDEISEFKKKHSI